MLSPGDEERQRTFRKRFPTKSQEDETFSHKVIW